MEWKVYVLGFVLSFSYGNILYIRPSIYPIMMECLCTDLPMAKIHPKLVFQSYTVVSLASPYNIVFSSLLHIFICSKSFVAQLKSLETTLAGSLRRERMAEISIKQLEAEIEQLNHLVVLL